MAEKQKSRNGGGLMGDALTMGRAAAGWMTKRTKGAVRLARTLKVRELLNGKALHGLIYAKFTTPYIRWLADAIPDMSPQQRAHWRDRYHAKILTEDQAEAIIRLDRRIARTLDEQIIPYPMARDLVLNGPPEVVAYECACRNRKEDHCEPTQVCMVIGEAANTVRTLNPRTTRRLTQDEAIALLREEHERGHLHSAWFKDVCGDRFYAICNCCKCCCVGIEAMVKYGSPVIASSGFVAQINEDRCIECGVCEMACPFDAIHVNGSVAVEWARCMGCGVCEGQCTTGAISLLRDERKGMPMDVRLMA
jgi:NAD-dependent dihydropyrimidine dehydrogenase PreA subunit